MGKVLQFPLTEAQVGYARMNRIYRSEIERVAELDYRTGRLHQANPRIVKAYFRAKCMVEYGRPEFFER
jgi:hypothetical protein